MDDLDHTPPVAIGVIETDAFCDRCGFNLHSQKVWRDGRLGILVCRCPECGAHQTAGVRTAVTSVWLNRLALVGLLIWVTLGLAFVVGTFFMHMGIQIGSAETLVTADYERRDGQAVNYNYGGGPTAPQWLLRADGQTPVTPAEMVQRTVLVESIGGPKADPSSPYSSNQIPLAAVLILGGIFALGTLVTAVIAATAHWFWPRRWRAAWIVLPLLACTLTVVLELGEESSRAARIRGGGISTVDRQLFWYVIAAVTLAQVLVVGFGLLVGRAIARFILTVLVPPRTRQIFAFLWLCDGKTMPPYTPKTP